MFHQAGLLNRVERNARKETNKNPCLINKKKQNEGPLNLRHFSGAFFVLGAGFTFAFLIFIGEFVLNLISNKLVALEI